MRIWTAILAGLQVMSAGTVLFEVWDKRYVGLFILAVAALQGGTVAYMRAPDQGYRPQHEAKEL